MEALVELHDNIMFYLVIILFAVGWIMVSIVRNYVGNQISNKYMNHGTLIELVWTVTPALILILIAFPSFKLLYLMDEVTDPNLTVFAEGHQWYWSYQYPDFLSDDNEELEFDSYLVPESDLEDGRLRMLEVDNRVILPEITHTRFIISSGDVIHSYACPSLGIKCDAYPGRLNQVSVLVNREGTFFGQCSEICGILHSSMPAVIQSVSLEHFLGWLQEQTIPFAVTLMATSKRSFSATAANLLDKPLNELPPQASSSRVEPQASSSRVDPQTPLTPQDKCDDLLVKSRVSHRQLLDQMNSVAEVDGNSTLSQQRWDLINESVKVDTQFGNVDGDIPATLDLLNKYTDLDAKAVAVAIKQNGDIGDLSAIASKIQETRSDLSKLATEIAKSPENLPQSSSDSTSEVIIPFFVVGSSYEFIPLTIRFVITTAWVSYMNGSLLSVYTRLWLIFDKLKKFVKRG
jgi:cytochrome c oxidase subunit 2